MKSGMWSSLFILLLQISSSLGASPGFTPPRVGASGGRSRSSSPSKEQRQSSRTGDGNEHAGSIGRPTNAYNAEAGLSKGRGGTDFMDTPFMLSKPAANSEDAYSRHQMAARRGVAILDQIEGLKPVPLTLQDPSYRAIPRPTLGEPEAAPFPPALQFAFPGHTPPSKDYVPVQFGGEAPGNSKNPIISLSAKDQAISYTKRPGGTNIADNHQSGVDKIYIVGAWRAAKERDSSIPEIKYIHWASESRRMANIGADFRMIPPEIMPNGGWETIPVHTEGAGVQIGSINGIKAEKYGALEERIAFSAFYGAPEAAEIDLMVRENPKMFGSGDKELVSVTILKDSGGMVWEIGSRAGRT
ncbi:hypothetical protein ABW19_dt0208790 [Dactylella cylindrospora]|nr:hypothetical protein ABW19_dt0208790 [Dactylella cylindrospora]